MRITMRCQERKAEYDYLESVVAVRPSRELLAHGTAAGVLARLRIERGANAGRGDLLPLAREGAWRFERAGWFFAEARPHLSESARTLGIVEGAAAVRPVLMDRGGNTLIATRFVIVQVTSALTRSEARSRLEADGLERIRRIPFGENLFEARLPPGPPFLEAVAALQARDWYDFAEPSFLQIISGRQAPNDPELGRQWHHRNDGRGGGKRNADIKALQAWAQTRGERTRIAIIDNGMQVDHPDLAAGVVFGGQFRLHESGGCTFFCHPSGEPFPDHPHGTFCMGMAGARADNREGGCGSAPEAGLIPIACAEDQVGTQATLAESIAFAANPGPWKCGLSSELGADVIACSLGSETGEWQICSVLDMAIQTAAKLGRGGRGTPILWAVSNLNVPIKRDQVCSHPDVIAVGRSSRRDVRVSGAFGDKLEFLAPGFRVLSTTSGGGYDVDDGTSFACPLAAGVAALALSVNCDLTRDEVLAVLRESCEKIGRRDIYVKGHNPYYGYGRIDAAEAVRKALARRGP
jgi:thermitase